MLKQTKKLALNFKILKFFLAPTLLFLNPLFINIQDVKAGLEFQWDQNSGYKRLKWFQKEKSKNFRNTTYFFLRPSDRNSDLLKIEQNEFNILSSFFPKQLNDEDTKKICEEIISKLGANSIKEMGKVMGELKKKHADEINLSKAGALLKKLLSK